MVPNIHTGLSPLKHIKCRGVNPRLSGVIEVNPLSLGTKRLKYQKKLICQDRYGCDIEFGVALLGAARKSETLGKAPFLYRGLTVIVTDI